MFHDYDDYYYDYTRVSTADLRLAIDSIKKLKEELAASKNEAAMLRKAYEELAEAKSGEEAKNVRLKEELADRDAVLSFLWDKMFPAK